MNDIIALGPFTSSGPIVIENPVYVGPATVSVTAQMNTIGNRHERRAKAARHRRKR